MYCRYYEKETEDGSRYCNACGQFLGSDGSYAQDGNNITMTYQRMGNGGAADKMDYCRKMNPKGMERDCIHYTDLGRVDVYFEKK